MSTTSKPPLSEIAAQWREARKLYVVYGALMERFALGGSPCPELESPIDRGEPETLQRVSQWFSRMDDRVHVHQLRQLLQTSRLGTEENLRALVSHHLEKENKGEVDRDKIDFLLVQYLSSCAPPGFYERNVEFDEIAQVLEPLLGEVGAHPPQWLQPLEQATAQLEALRSLRDLLEQGTLDQMRKLKSGAGEMYFGPTALAAITRFNFFVRRTFVRLIAADLHAIRFSLHELERRGVTTVDCTRAELGPAETLEALRDICHEWKKPFRAAYAAGQNFKQLIEIRSAVEDALARAPEAGSAPAPSPVAVRDVAPPAAAPGGNGISEPEAAAAAAPPPQPTAPVLGGPIPLEVRQSEPLPKSDAAPSLISTLHVEHPSERTAASAEAAPGPETAAVLSELQSSVEHIKRDLGKAAVKPGAVANVVLNGIKLMLSSWEVASFLQGSDETAERLQRAVAARALLMAPLERRKKGETVDLRAAIKTAQLESAKIQARIAVAKEAKDIDSAVNLAATSKRLSALLEEADKAGK